MTENTYIALPPPFSAEMETFIRLVLLSTNPEEVAAWAFQATPHFEKFVELFDSIIVDRAQAAALGFLVSSIWLKACAIGSESRELSEQRKELVRALRKELADQSLSPKFGGIALSVDQVRQVLRHLGEAEA